MLLYGGRKKKQQNCVLAACEKQGDDWLIRLCSKEHFKGPTWESERNQSGIKLLLSPVAARWGDFKTGEGAQEGKGEAAVEVWVLMFP